MLAYWTVGGMMGFQLWIHQDVRLWLTSLRDRDPELARLAGEAVLALMEGGDFPSPPLAVPMRSLPWEPEGPWIDPEHRRPQDVLQRTRRALANVTTTRNRTEFIVSQLEARATEPASQDQLSELRRELAALRREQDRLTALVADQEKLITPGEGLDSGDGQPIRPVAPPMSRADTPNAMALRLGAPDHVRAGLLFMVPAPGTAVLLAHVASPGASPDDYQVALAAAVVATSRPDAAGDAAFTSYDAPAFLDEFYPGEQAEIGLRAASLLARFAVHTLAQVRQRMELTQAQVAERMNVRLERVSAIERAGPGAIEVRTLAAYVAALGGSLEIIARIDGDPINLH